MDTRPDSLLHDLQRGERVAFARYYELYRAPVYDLVRRLLHDGEDAVSATQEVFTAAYRRILLNDGHIDLQDWTYAAAIDVCCERLDRREADGDVAPRAAAEADRREPGDLGGRIALALETVEFRHQAVLLLHDIHGLRPDQLATVFGVTEDAASALLFHAREAFRRAFEELSSERRTETCRVAELVAAGAVGRTLSNGEVRRLGEHAAFCPPCRQTMKGWGGDAIGLGLFLEAAPLPQALTMTPVFGTVVPITGTPSVVADVGVLTRALSPIGRSLTSRAAAYVLAAACLAVTVGLVALQPLGDRSFVVVPAGGARVPLFVQPTTSDASTSDGRGDQASATGTGSSAGASIATSTGSASDSWAPSEFVAGTIELPLAAVADAGLSPAGARATAGDTTASGADNAGAAKPGADAKGDAKTKQPGRSSAAPGRSGGGNGGKAQAAAAHSAGPAKHVPAGGKPHKDKKTKKSKKDH